METKGITSCGSGDIVEFTIIKEEYDVQDEEILDFVKSEENGFMFESVLDDQKQIQIPQSSLNSRKIEVKEENDFPITCNVCHALIWTEKMVTYHRKKHGTNPLACYTCQETFKNMLDLKKHENQCPKPNQEFKLIMKKKNETFWEKYECFLCAKTFSHKFNLEQHMDYHKSKKFHVCHLCGLDYRWQNSLKNHIRHHQRGELPIKCLHCEGKFRTRKVMLWHITSAHKHTRQRTRKIIKKNESSKQEQYECYTCLRPFANKLLLQAHMLHHDENIVKKHRQYFCTLCDLIFFHNDDLIIHLERHKRGELPFKCTYYPHCKGLFVSKNAVLYHISTKHKNKEENIEEQEIKKQEIKVEIMDVNKITQNPETIRVKEDATSGMYSEEKNSDKVSIINDFFRCSICFKVFFNRDRFGNHMDTHKERTLWHTCTQCGLQYRWYHTLLRHRKQHEQDELPLKCTQCDGRFRTEHGILMHMKNVHKINNDNEKIFGNQTLICNICSYQCVTLRGLHCHMTIHDENRKRITCPQCGLVYYNSALMEKHLMFHKRGELLFKCKHCEGRFKTKSAIKKHMQKVRQNEANNVKLIIN